MKLEKQACMLALAAILLLIVGAFVVGFPVGATLAEETDIDLNAFEGSVILDDPVYFQEATPDEPEVKPTQQPTIEPTQAPGEQPTVEPTHEPTAEPAADAKFTVQITPPTGWRNTASAQACVDIADENGTGFKQVKVSTGGAGWVWANKEIFKLNPELKASELAGCPPDCFSPDGQLWGNPVYDWKKLKKQKYSWWIERLNQSFKIYDIVRIDHFRGFESYYSVKAGSNTARKGLWRKGGGKSFFDALPKEFKNKIIAENLGFLTKEVDELLKYTGFPGMKVLQFSFDSRDDNGKSLPDDFEKNNVVYTGTHDNDTVLGWYNTADKKDVAYAMRYLGAKDKFDLVDKMNECAMNSNANTCILTMQDLLCLGSEARMNTPSTMGENWKWRMSKDDLTSSLANKLLDITKKSGRCVNG